jgi:hypothetical protein
MATRRTIEDFQRDLKERKAQSTPGDDERKQRILRNGIECLRRLHGDQTWEDWMGTGEAMMVITEEVLADLALVGWDADNKQLTKEFVRRWEQYERTAGDNHKPLTKQERWALREVMTRPEIGAWRAGELTGPEKRRLNHPNAVINRWKTKTQPREPKKERQPSPLLSPALTARDNEIEALKAQVQELEAAREGLKAAREELEATRETAALTMEQHFAALIDLLKDETPQHAQQMCNDFARRLTAALNARRKQGVPTHAPAPDKAMEEGLKQVKADMNAALAGLSAASKRKGKAKGLK